MSLGLLVDLGCDDPSHHSAIDRGHKKHNGQRLEAIKDGEVELQAREIKI